MELSFILTALRRRWWLVALGAILGAVPGMLAGPSGPGTFESTATLSVEPPTPIGAGTFFDSQPDRYVVSQVSVIGSAGLAQQVADEIGDGATVVGILASVEIEQEPETDIVNVTATADSAARAQEIAQAYVDLYLANEIAQNDTSQDTEISSREARLVDIQVQLDQINENIRVAMEPLIQDAIDAQVSPPIASQVVPGLVSQRELLQTEYASVLQAKTQLELSARLKVNTRIVQNATLPSLPESGNANLALIGGIVAGAMLGVAVAVVSAQFSNKVLDEVATGEMLAVPVIGDLPNTRVLSRHPEAAFENLPGSLVGTIDQLCVHAEARAAIDRPLVVTVIGTQRGAGATTTAVAMAGRFADAGHKVLLVDGDARDPWITQSFNATRHGGIPALLGAKSAGNAATFTASSLPNVDVLGLGREPNGASLRRDAVPALLQGARRHAGIVIVDAGPLLDAAVTVQLCHASDAVVLCVPLADQRADALATVRRQLDAIADRLLPIITNPSSKPAAATKLAQVGRVVAEPGQEPRSRPEPAKAAPSNEPADPPRNAGSNSGANGGKASNGSSGGKGASTGSGNGSGSSTPESLSRPPRRDGGSSGTRPR